MKLIKATGSYKEKTGSTKRRILKAKCFLKNYKKKFKSNKMLKKIAKHSKILSQITKNSKFMKNLLKNKKILKIY